MVKFPFADWQPEVSLEARSAGCVHYRLGDYWAGCYAPCQSESRILRRSLQSVRICRYDLQLWTRELRGKPL